jgi:hypothetical protein
MPNYVSLKALAKTLDNAANHIQVHGWWRPGYSDENPLPAACISNAIAYVTEGEHIEVAQAAQEALLGHFGLNELRELFVLNDSQPFNIGKEWAIEHLRETAHEIRQMQRTGAAI